MRNAPDGIYLTHEQADENGQFPTIERISLLPDGLELGAGDSHHGVLFCEVLIEDDGGTRPVSTAIKPFSTESGHARQEFDSLIAAQRMGFDTFEPLALAKHGETTFLITRRRPEINSLDNAAWNISPNDTDKYEKELLPSLELMVNYLARMHSSGLFHGDAQAKNFAITDTGGSLITDLEDAVIATDSESLIACINGGDNEPSEGLAYADLTHCWYALIHPINKSPNLFLEGESYDTCMMVFERDFLNPYIEKLTVLLHPALHERLNTSGLRQAVFDYIARTT